MQRREIGDYEFCFAGMTFFSSKYRLEDWIENRMQVYGFELELEINLGSSNRCIVKIVSYFSTPDARPMMEQERVFAVAGHRVVGCKVVAPQLLQISWSNSRVERRLKTATRSRWYR